MAKVLILHYSRTGTVRQAALQLQQISGWAMGEVRDPTPRVGFLGDLRCVIDSVLGRSAPYVYDGPPPESFDRWVVLAPIWVDGLASPMRALMRDIAHHGRPVSLVCVMARTGAFRAADEVTTIDGSEPHPVLALKQSDVLDGHCRAELSTLVDTVNALGTGPVIATPVDFSPRPA
ncbi:MAG: hypothetical protein ABI702_03725 [Burkholderiales bacterium]